MCTTMYNNVALEIEPKTSFLLAGTLIMELHQQPLMHFYFFGALTSYIHPQRPGTNDQVGMEFTFFRQINISFFPHEEYLDHCLHIKYIWEISNALF